MKMKKLTVALVLVGLLTLPIVGLAEGQANPPKPGTQTNPGLHWAGLKGFINSNGANYWGYSWAMWLWFMMAPPGFTGK